MFTNKKGQEVSLTFLSFDAILKKSLFKQHFSLVPSFKEISNEPEGQKKNVMENQRYEIICCPFTKKQIESPSEKHKSQNNY